jgi:hypothetical protein
VGATAAREPLGREHASQSWPSAKTSSATG